MTTGRCRPMLDYFFRPTTEQRYTSSVGTIVISGFGPGATLDPPCAAVAGAQVISRAAMRVRRWQNAVGGRLFALVTTTLVSS